MRSNDGGRCLWLSGVVAAACSILVSGQPLRAAHSPAEACLQRLPVARLEEQLLCLRKLREAGPAAVAATPTLCDVLIRSDGTTDHVLIAAALDVLRSMGHRAAPAAETLSSLLPHRSKLYKDRDKLLVVRLRAYIMVTLSEIGFPSSALPALLDTLAHVDGRMTPIEVGAAARAVGSLGPRGRELAPYLLDALVARLSAEEFSLERFDPEFPPDEATTVQLEVVRSLAKVCSAEDRDALAGLRQLAEDRGGEDPRVVREAQRALKLILSARGEQQ